MTGCLMAAALLLPAPAGADPVAAWQPLIADAAARFALPPAWVADVMRAESGGRLWWAGRPITSSAGAMGLMQLMPATWRSLRGALRLGDDPHDPHDNVIAGTAYLRGLYDRFGYPGLFAAYHAGPGRYQRALSGARALPDATLAYVATLTRQRPLASAPTLNVRALPADQLFAVRKASRPDVPAPTGQPDGLFVRLATPHI